MQFAFGNCWVFLEVLWVTKKNPIVLEIICRVLGVA
jgi:hypothetical protein